MPDLATIGRMKHGRLIDCLLQCPESKYFNFSPAVFNKKSVPKRRAVSLVFEMVRQSVIIKRFSTIQEEGSVPNSSQSLASLVDPDDVIEEEDIAVKLLREEVEQPIDESDEEEEKEYDEEVDQNDDGFQEQLAKED